MLPSKIYGVLAAGRPITFVKDADGEIASLVRGNEVGIAVGHGDGASLAEQIKSLARNSDRCISLGYRAKKCFDEQYGIEKAKHRWLQVLSQIFGGSGRKF